MSLASLVNRHPIFRENAGNAPTVSDHAHASGLLPAMNYGMRKNTWDCFFCQNLLPLIVLAIPIGIFCAALIGGLNVGLLTLVVSFSAWTLPTVQVRISRFELSGLWGHHFIPCALLTRILRRVLEGHIRHSFDLFQIKFSNIFQGSISLVFVLRLNKTFSSESGKTSSQARKITIPINEH